MNFYVKHSIYTLRFISKLQLNQRNAKGIDSVRFQQNFVAGSQYRGQILFVAELKTNRTNIGPWQHTWFIFKPVQLDRSSHTSKVGG